MTAGKLFSTFMSSLGESFDSSCRLYTQEAAGGVTEAVWKYVNIYSLNPKVFPLE